MPSNGDKPHRKVTNANGGGELILNERGVREHRGRAAGTPNRTTRILKDAILLAAERAGMPEIEHDDKGHIVSATPGEGGLDAYLLSCALYERRAFMTLLGRVLPFQLNLKADVGERIVYQSSEQVKRIIVERGLDRLLKDEIIISQPLKRKS